MTGKPWTAGALVPVKDSPAIVAAKHEAEAQRLGMESTNDLVAMLRATAAHAGDVAKLKTIPGGVIQTAERIQREATAHADMIVGIISNLNR